MQVDPNTQLGNLYQMYAEMEMENAIKLKQILDLEEILYSVRVFDEDDGSPCWLSDCVFTGNYHDGTEWTNHSSDCIKARQATEPFWKK